MSLARIDMLGESTERLTALSGTILEPELDNGLQALAAEAAERLHMPIALVALILRRVQFYRAYVGLPKEVELAGATDRCVGLCQTVLRSDAVVAIEDTRTAEVPQLLVDRYGIRAYLGAPVKLGGHAIGTLCVVGVEPRKFTDEDRRLITELAARASSRMAEMALPPATPAVADRVVGDGFARAQTLVNRLSTDIALARVATLELGTGVRLLEQVMSADPARYNAWLDLPRAHQDLQEMLTALESTARELRTHVSSLERATLPWTGGAVGDAVQSAIQLAVPGVVLAGPIPQRTLAAPRALVVSMLAALIGAVAGTLGEVRGALTVSAREDGASVVVVIERPGLANAAAVAGEFNRLAEGSPLQARADGGRVTMVIPVNP